MRFIAGRQMGGAGSAVHEDRVRLPPAQDDVRGAQPNVQRPLERATADERQGPSGTQAQRRQPLPQGRIAPDGGNGGVVAGEEFVEWAHGGIRLRDNKNDSYYDQHRDDRIDLSQPNPRWVGTTATVVQAKGVPGTRRARGDVDPGYTRQFGNRIIRIILVSIGRSPYPTAIARPAVVSTSRAVLSPPSPDTGAFALSDLPLGTPGRVVGLRPPAATREARELALRLLEIGFMEGEPVRVIAHGHPGREPIAVRVGGTTFALRRFEAEQVMVAACR
jgi:ferrous iron transport protein A